MFNILKIGLPGLKRSAVLWLLAEWLVLYWSTALEGDQWGKCECRKMGPFKTPSYKWSKNIPCSRIYLICGREFLFFSKLKRFVMPQNQWPAISWSRDFCFAELQNKITLHREQPAKCNGFDRCGPDFNCSQQISSYMFFPSHSLLPVCPKKGNKKKTNWKRLGIEAQIVFLLAWDYWFSFQGLPLL